MIDLDLIRIDGGTQSRVELNEETVAEYRDAYLAGAEFPPVIVFFDGTDRWLADGFHRYFGAKAAGRTTIYENIASGSRRDAVLHSLKANAKHGLKRTNADKRKAVELMLADDEWAAWSDRKIAEACGVSDKTVASVRTSHCGNSEVRNEKATERTYTTKHGTTAVMKTSNIGKAPASASAPLPAAPEPAAPAPTDDREQAPAAAPSAPAPTTDGEVENLRAEVVRLTSENEELSARLAETATDLAGLVEDNEVMARVFEADDKVVAALAEAKRHRELNRLLNERVNGLLNEKNEAIRAAKSWKRRAEGK